MTRKRVPLGGKGRPKIRDIDRLIKMYKRGKSTVELAKVFNTTPQAICYRLRRMGVIRTKDEAQKIRRLKEYKVTQ